MEPEVLLLTRPVAQSRAFARSLGPVGAEVVIAPLTGIVALDWDRRLAEGVAGVVLTSANAVPAVAGLAPLPAWCVGGATARAAEAAGFRVRTSGGDAVALIADLTRDRPAGVWLHPHGRDLSRDIAADLAPAGIRLRGVPVYAAAALDWPAGLAGRLAGRRVVAPVFSPRAAALLSERVPALAAGSVVVAISDAAAARLSPALRAIARIAAQPTGMRQAVLAALVP